MERKEANVKLLKEWHNLQCTDKRLCWCIQHAFDSMILRRLYGNHGGEKGRTPTSIFEHLTRCLSLVGSSVEGAAISHLFEVADRTVEVDMMYKIATLDKAMATHVINYFEQKPGFCNVYNNDHFAKALATELHGRPVEGTGKVDYFWAKLAYEKPAEREFLSGTIVKALTEKYFKFRDSISRNIQVNGISQTIYEQHGPAINLIITLTKGVILDKRQIGVSLDYVTYIQIDAWPMQAEEWISRNRSWPNPDLVARAVECGHQLVAKPFKLVMGKIDPDEWRISFTKAENFLTKHRSQGQQLINLIAKCIFYKYLNVRVDGKKFSSYILKTVMMGHMEKCSMLEDWAENYMEHVQTMFVDMEQAVNNKHLPHYFINTLNIMEEYPPGLLKHISDILADINKDLPRCVPEEVTQVAQSADRLITNAQMVIAEVMQKRFNKEQ